MFLPLSVHGMARTVWVVPLEVVGLDVVEEYLAALRHVLDPIAHLGETHGRFGLKGLVLK